jgi:hypothetical protein
MKLTELTILESSGYSLQGSFTPDLTESKVWLIRRLAQVSPKVGNMYVLGSWFGNLSLYLHLLPRLQHGRIINVEIDPKMLRQSARMLHHIGARDVDHQLADANQLDYRDLGADGVVVNCSLTSMPKSDWFHNIPSGTLVVLQARDHDPGTKYRDVQDILDKFPLRVLYQGTRSLRDPETKYQRFMVIGHKL